MNERRASAVAIPRRSFFAIGGAGVAAGVLAGCGGGEGIEEPSESRDLEILGEALVGEENTASALQIAEGEVEGAELKTVKAMRERASALAVELQDEIDKIGSAPDSGDFGLPPQERTGALESALAETERAVAAYRRGAGQFSSEELRMLALELIASDAARLSLLSDLLGNQLAPYAFVTGGKEEPYSSSDSDEDSEEDTETTETSTTTTSTTGEGG